MNHPLSKREAALIGVTAFGLLLVVFSAIKIIHLNRTIAANNQAQGTTLRMKDNNYNAQAGYIDTVCGEYRKLYRAYKDLAAKNHVGMSYAIPGSAKGEVDECYR